MIRHTVSAANKARSLDELRRILTDEIYDALEGVYSGLPTWGPAKTPAVEALIASSCADGDIVSWDTRPADVNRHRFLMRRWTPAMKSQGGCEHEFYIVTHAEVAEWENVQRAEAEADSATVAEFEREGK